MADRLPDIEVAPPTDAELPAFADLCVRSLGFTPPRELDWVSREHRPGLRVARLGADVVGTLGLVPLQQWFGGRAVPMGGIRCVTAAPHVRGRGVAGALLRAALVDCAAQGLPLAALYPSTQPVYRRAGFEQAGVRIGWWLPLRALDVPRPPATITFRPLRSPADDGAVQALHWHASQRPGNLHRDPWTWRRIREPLWGAPAEGTMVLRGGRPAGYVYLQRDETAAGHFSFQAMDHEAVDPEALRALLWFGAQHRSMATELHWHGGPADALATLLPGVRARPERVTHWMLRVVDLAAAVAARGWPAPLQADCHLDIDDPACPAHHGRFRLRVSDGRALLAPGGEGRLRLTARALGPLYSGHASAFALREAGLAQGDDATCAAASACFAGPAPWMREGF